MEKKGYHVFNGDTVKIMSCSDCNVKCKHCYITHTGQLTDEQLYDMVSKLSDRFEIRVNGTEPLLHPEYLKSIEAGNQKMILTNGLVFKDNYDYIDLIKSYGIETIGISYHFDLHDSISPVKRDYLDRLFQEILDRGLDVQVMTTITSSTYKKVPDYCEYCADNRIRKIRFTNFMLQGNAVNMDSDLVLSDDERMNFFEIIDNMRKKYPKEVLRIQRCGTFGNDRKINSNFSCPAGNKAVAITPDYKVYPCIFLIKPEYLIGYYEDGNIYIKDNFENDHNECMAMKVLNKEMKI